jgi:hypothetical protein
MANHSSDGFTEFRIAIMMLWAGVAFGLIAVAARSFALQTIIGGNDGTTGTSLLISGLVLIFLQGRLIMRLSAGQGAVRGRILLLAIFRILVYVPNFVEMMAVSTYLILPALIAAILQLGALFLLYTPPGSHRFATAGRRV